MREQYQYDVILIGGGAAGLTVALHLANSCRIALITKVELSETATKYAQGGVSAVMDEKDSLASHIEDTLSSGAGLCDPAVVRFAVEHGRECIQWLMDCGVPFTTETRADGRTDFHLTQEGGHSHRRVVHAADATGYAIETTLESRILEHPNIDVFENHIAVDLITTARLNQPPKRCVGVYAFDKTRQCVNTFKASCVVLATGGAGKAYLYTTNPDVASGDGIAMAWRAGCRVANMEFIQFHPTCLYHPEAKSFLITEALRGEGAKLLLPDGSRFMDKYSPRGELAPRDIVARAIDNEMKRLGIESVFLDISHKPAEFITQHFPTIYKRCLDFGFDITRDPLPVVPAAHYTCGGVMTNTAGQTDIPGLYAVGETAYTGFHGANRMASNSLLECLVFGMAAAKDITARLATAVTIPALPDWDESQVTKADEEIVIAHNWDELRRAMWDYVGIVRSTERLLKAKRRVEMLRNEAEEYYARFCISNDLIELRNLSLVAELIVRCALARKESRGLHYTKDFPEASNSNQVSPTVLLPENFEAMPQGAAEQQLAS